MAQARSASDLINSFAFDKRVTVDRGDGVMVGEFEQQFTRRAGVVHMRGGEAVMADRLQGRHTQVVFVRACPETREVDASWQVRNARTGEVFNIRDVTPTEDRQWIDFLCQSGVNPG